MNKNSLVAVATRALAFASALAVSGPSFAADHVPMSGPINRMDTTKPGVPGPRTCFWALGPFSGDPYLNIAWPDTNTFYWASKFTVPQGAKLQLEGQFAHARYAKPSTPGSS